jgi:hypothetical protein
MNRPIVPPVSIPAYVLRSPAIRALSSNCSIFRFMCGWCMLPRQVGAGGQPAHAPLRNVRETFASHGSNLSKARPFRADPRPNG